MKNYDWKQWARAAGMRAVKTVAQTAVATIGTAAMISEVDWKLAISASLLAGVISLLTSVAGLPELQMPDTAEAPEEIDEAEEEDE